MKRMVTMAGASVIAGLVAHFGIFYFLDFEQPEMRKRPPPASTIHYVGSLGAITDPVIQEQGLLFDSAPLFMPTEWNLASELGSVASLREATEVFASFPADLSLPEQLPDVRESTVREIPPSLRELPRGPAFVLSPFGRVADPGPELLPEPTVLKAQRLDGDSPSGTISVEVPSRMQQFKPRSLWIPAQLHLQLSKGRPLGFPVVARSSGFTEWDEALQQFIGSLAFTKSLSDGYYLITAYP